MGYVFLASPYSAPTLQVRVNRFMVAQDAATFLVKEGRAVYSPIVHWHHIAELRQLPKDAKFWERQNTALLAGAEDIYVLTIPGWKESTGVRNELLLARRYDLRCFLLNPVKEGFALAEMPFKSWTPDSVLTQ